MQMGEELITVSDKELVGAKEERNIIIRKKQDINLTSDGERLNNQSTVGDVLKQIIQVNKLQPGMDQIDVKDAWKPDGNGVNSYTKNVVLKGSTLYVELSSSVFAKS
jgi:hypothetical protein